MILAIHDGIGGDPDTALAGSAVTVSGSWQTQRVSHGQLETHGTIGWLDEDGRLVLRTSSQVPFLVRDELALLLDLPKEKIGCSPSGSAAGSAASRRSSPRTWWPSRCCAPAGRSATR